MRLLRFAVTAAMVLAAAASFAHPSAAASRAAMVHAIRDTASEYAALSTDPHFLAAVDGVAKIDRRQFIPKKLWPLAYRDVPLPIGYGQTISDPYIVAIMTGASAVTPGSSVLEIGTGSGYQAALLSLVGATVHSIEIVAPLARAAKRRLHRLGYPNVTVRAGDGFKGWSEYGPYDAIIVTAGAAAVPKPLLAQLKPGGRLVMPIGANAAVEQLLLFTRHTDNSLTRCSLGPAMFVPLTGRGGHIEQPGLYDRSVPLCYRGQTARWPGQPAG